MFRVAPKCSAPTNARSGRTKTVLSSTGIPMLTEYSESLILTEILVTLGTAYCSFSSGASMKRRMGESDWT